ncbi:Amidase [Nesidiocoris tenuis]|uniref:Amidase n=1 Tax=Nesidiocoris tenuis TaxID=355587 RepID=A0ABN7AKM8_9HEMI|nr:Amidase [Nesidiocoris tenuis]
MTGLQDLEGGKLRYWFKFLIAKSTLIFLWLYATITSIHARKADYKIKKRVPPIKHELCKKSVSELVSLLKNKQVSSHSIVEQYIDHIQNVNKVLNCLVDERFAEALEESKRADAAIQTANDVEELFSKQPLLGIPFTVKENLAVKGLKHSSARTRVPVRIADEDADAVSRLRARGGIPLLVSNAPELCLNIETVSKIGRTRNPYDTTKTVGGSSGGEASLLGSGASAVGIASDIVGSIRIPAMFCGVYGHKPTPGCVSIKGHIPISTDPKWDYYFTVGPMVRYAVDLPLIFKNMVSEESLPSLRLDVPVEVSRIKVYYMVGEGELSLTQSQPSERVRLALETAIQSLKDHHNCVCEKVDLNYMVDSADYNQAVLAMKGVENVFQASDDPEDWGTTEVLWMFLKKLLHRTDADFGALLWGPMRYLAKLESLMSNTGVERRIEKGKFLFTEMLGDDAVFIYPTFSVEAQKHHAIAKHAMDVSYTSVFNVFGVPATQCPIKIDAGLPVGVQVVAAPHQDRLCFAIAQALETTCGGWIPPS